MPEYDDYDQRDPYPDNFDDRSSSADVANARSRVAAPAILLMILGVITILGSVFNFTQMGSFDQQWDEQMEKLRNDPKYSEDERKQIEDFAKDIKGPVKSAIPVLSGLGVLAGLLTFFGGMSMKGLKNRGLAYTAAILSIIPCTSGCCLVGLPVGIWALVVLGNSEVKNGFDAVARGLG